MKEIIQTDNAPKAIGPYSQAVRHGDLIYLSGQIPLKPDTMEVVCDTAFEQTILIMKNIGEILKAAGSNYSKVLKCTIYLTDMNDFQSVNEQYAKFFPENPPARATVQVARLPKDVKVEIDCIAHI